EVRDALKRLGGVTVFTGEVRAGDVPLPILPPAGKRPTTIRTSAATPEPKAAKPLPPEKTPPQPDTAQDTAPPPSNNSGERRTIWWVLGMGAMMMVGVFVVAGFLLYLLPSMREKRAATNQAISNPIADHKAVEPWVRLEEFSRSPREESSKKPEASPKPVIPEPEPLPIATPAETLKAALDRSHAAQPDPEPSNGDANPVRGPRRRRGVAERPWWRELPTPDQVTSILPDNKENGNQVPAATGFTLPVKPAPPPSMIDAYDADTVVLPAGAAN